MKYLEQWNISGSIMAYYIQNCNQLHFSSQMIVFVFARIPKSGPYLKNSCTSTQNVTIISYTLINFIWLVIQYTLL